MRISNAGVEAVLSERKQERSANLGTYSLGSPAGGPTWNGHPFYILTIPLAERTLVYDLRNAAVVRPGVGAERAKRCSTEGLSATLTRSA